MFLGISSIAVVILLIITCFHLGKHRLYSEFDLVAFGVMIIFPLLVSFAMSYEGNKIYKLELDTMIDKCIIADDINLNDKTLQFNKSNMNGIFLPIINEEGKVVYKYIPYNKNMEIINNSETSYIEIYSMNKVATIKSEVSFLTKCLMSAATFKDIKDVKIKEHLDDLYYKIYIK